MSWLFKNLFCLNDISQIHYMLRKYQCQERNWLFKGLFSLVDVSVKIRKEGFYLKLLVFLVSSKDFKPK